MNPLRVLLVPLTLFVVTGCSSTSPPSSPDAALDGGAPDAAACASSPRPTCFTVTAGFCNDVGAVEPVCEHSAWTCPSGSLPRDACPCGVPPVDPLHCRSDGGSDAGDAAIDAADAAIDAPFDASRD